MSAGNLGQEGDSSELRALAADGESFAHSHALWFSDRKLPTALEALLVEKSGVWWSHNHHLIFLSQQRPQLTTNKTKPGLNTEQSERKHRLYLLHCCSIQSIHIEL